MKKIIIIALSVSFIAMTVISSFAFEKGDNVYACYKVAGLECLIQWGFGCGYQPCEGRIVDVGESNVEVKFEWGCGAWVPSGSKRWLSKSQIYYNRDACDDL